MRGLGIPSVLWRAARAANEEALEVEFSELESGRSQSKIRPEAPPGQQPLGKQDATCPQGRPGGQGQQDVRPTISPDFEGIETIETHPTILSAARVRHSASNRRTTSEPRAAARGP